jgi:hypothetical protein
MPHSKTFTKNSSHKVGKKGLFRFFWISFIRKNIKYVRSAIEDLAMTTVLRGNPAEPGPRTV